MKVEKNAKIPECHIKNIKTPVFMDEEDYKVTTNCETNLTIKYLGVILGRKAKNLKMCLI